VKIQKLATTAGLIALLTVSGVALAGGPFGGDGDGFGHRGMRGGPGDMLGMLPRLLHHLDLSEDQQAEVEAILEEARPAIHDLRQQMREARETHMASQTPGVFDEAQARTFAETVGSLTSDLTMTTLETHARVLAVLTPDQLAQLEELREQWGKGRGRRGQSRGPGQGS